jgi:hypothetical protein
MNAERDEVVHEGGAARRAAPRRRIRFPIAPGSARSCSTREGEVAMKRLLVAAVAAVALVVAGCGADSKSCTTSSAQLAAGSAVQSCTVPAGGTANIQVRLCPRCSDSSPSCVTEFRNNAIEIDPILRECEEDRGCPIGDACENDPAKNRVTCTVAIPSSASGTIPVFLSSTGSQVAQVDVGSDAGCSFALAGSAGDAP